MDYARGGCSDVRIDELDRGTTLPVQFNSG